MPTDRSTGRGLALQPLWRRPLDGPGAPGDQQVRGGALPPALAARYGSPLAIPLRPDRPTIVANFVESLDGVVALGQETAGGGEISGFFEPDRFVMGLLRCLADAIVVGAETVRTAPGHVWTPRRVDRAHAEDYEGWRRAMELAPQPTTVIVTASGRLDTAHPALNGQDVPAIVVTTAGGERALGAAGLPSSVRVVRVAGSDRVSAADILGVLSNAGARLALSEGGPHLLGELLAADAVDELFLTIAPQVVGRSTEHPGRLAFAEGTAFGAGEGRWLDLISVHRSGDHLFLRHRARRAAGGAGPRQFTDGSEASSR